MRSPLKLAVLIVCLAGAAQGQPRDTPASPNSDDVRAAVAKLRRDPNLGHEETHRRLHWKNAKSPPPPADGPAWLVSLFEYLGSAGSLLIWIVGAVVIAVAVVASFRFFKSRMPAPKIARPKTISHVGDLDIRPDSLPEDIGAAARTLLDAGRIRDALSLLYRGALSRAVHGFGAPIQESHTEAEALRVVTSTLDAPRADYFRALVGLWQSAVYAGRPAAVEPVAALCSSFAATLGTQA